MSRPTIPTPVVLRLWASHAGRCARPGCNKPLWRDGLSLVDLNQAHVAHIIAASPAGPRGDERRSRELAKDFRNLLLLCREDHNLIDHRSTRHQYPAELLRGWKSDHERRIETVTAISPARKTEVVRLTANIGRRKPAIELAAACEALGSDWYPASVEGTSIDLTGSELTDEAPEFWTSSAEDIRRQVELKLRSRPDLPEHLSVFALAPMPLLVAFGAALGDLRPMEVYQLHREGGWAWPGATRAEEITLLEPECASPRENAALLLSLSGIIHRAEAETCLPSGTPIYELRAAAPGRDMMRSRDQLRRLRRACRHALTRIRSECGPEVALHTFLAMPASAAVELGRLLLPKSDPRLHLYDHDSNIGGFRRVLRI